MTFREQAANWDEVSTMMSTMVYHIYDPFELEDYERDLWKFYELQDSRLYSLCQVKVRLDKGKLTVDYHVVP